MTHSELEAETEKLVEAFYNYLKQEKGLSEETSSAHAHHISFFAVHYLRGYKEKSLLEVTDMDIEDYLGNWYIRKVWAVERLMFATYLPRSRNSTSSCMNATAWTKNNWMMSSQRAKTLRVTSADLNLTLNSIRTVRPGIETMRMVYG